MSWKHSRPITRHKITFATRQPPRAISGVSAAISSRVALGASLYVNEVPARKEVRYAVQNSQHFAQALVSRSFEHLLTPLLITRRNNNNIVVQVKQQYTKSIRTESTTTISNRVALCRNLPLSSV